MKSYYELLELPRKASPEEIKHAFRREIAKYHPDKVHHLGQEFQEMALQRAAELTQAYKTLSDPSARADYDAQLSEPVPPSPPSATATTAPSTPAAGPSDTPRDPEPPPGSVFAQDRAGASSLVLRATIARFRTAVTNEFGTCQEPSVAGFDVACVPKAAFWSLKLPPRVLGRFLPHVDGPAVAEAWTLASRMKKDAQRDLCVFVMGPSVAPPGELAAVIADQRRKPMPAGGKMVLVPVNTRTWHAHVPTDAPPAVKSLLSRLKSA